ncbi:DUF4349 domain-containing protein [Frankia sp. Cas3]|uniref:DUF4349 domain-containing protein n=1 Tax=Frankia sp. Cas3 TaxID=3073926 RepID=UPI002AD452FA|nr:DUF4349 domain-containing protein [Frankia sp. Cas3]
MPGSDTREPDGPVHVGPPRSGSAAVDDPFAKGRYRRRWIVLVPVAVGTLAIMGVVLGIGGGKPDVGSSSAALPVAPGIARSNTGSGPDAGSNTGSGSGAGAASTDDSGLSVSSGSAAVPEPGTTGVTEAQPGGRSDPARPAGAEPRIVRIGSVSLWVRLGGVDAAVSDIEAAAKGLGGYLSALESTGTAAVKDGDGPHANVTLRVPSGSFEQLRSQVGKIGDVRASTVSTRDVTGQYVDLESRRKALQNSRDTYLALLAKAGTIGEVLSVRQQIDSVQMQIEQLEGQRQVLADSSDLATLTVGVSEQGAVTKPGPATDDGGLGRAARLSWDRFVGGLGEVVALIGPMILIVLAATTVYAGYRLARRVRRRTGRPTAPMPPTPPTPPTPPAPPIPPVAPTVTQP